MSEAALYRHFASKAQMYEGLIEFIETTLFTLVNKIAGETPDGAAQAQQIVAVLLGFAEKNPGMTRVLIGDALVNEDERLQARMNQLYDRIEAALRQALRIAQASGSWPGRSQCRCERAGRLRARPLAALREERLQARRRRTAGTSSASSCSGRGRAAGPRRCGLRVRHAPAAPRPRRPERRGVWRYGMRPAAAASGARRTGYDDPQTGHCGSRGMRTSRQRIA